MTAIDINCDMGELPEAIADGSQEAIMPHLTSVSIACGGHAGDATTMRATIEQALRWNVAIGAHPSYPDRENFGRTEMNLPPEAVARAIFEQLTALDAVVKQCGARIVHVKPHGALYNQAVDNPARAAAIARGVAQWRRDVVLVGMAGSPMLDAFRAADFRAVGEAFADRRYEPNGTLRSRRFEDALIRDPAVAARQALDIVERGSVTTAGGASLAVHAETICIHGDTPGAAKIAEAVAASLRAAGIVLCSLSA